MTPSFPSWHRFPGRYVIGVGGVAALLFVLEHINGRFWLNDFRVYWGSANALIHGEPLYGVAHGLGTGIFKYAPVIALLFVPLAVLPYPLAASIQFALIAAAFIGALLRADRLLRNHLFAERPGAYAPLLLTTLVVVVHLHRELHLGNINVMLLWLLLLGLQRLLQGRARSAGVLLGLAVIAKPHFLVLLPWLVLRRRFTELGILLATIAAGLLLPMLVFGPERGIALHAEWFAQMAQHNASLVYLGGAGYEAVNTVYSFVHRAWLHRFLPGPNTGEIATILSAMAAGIGIVVLRNIRRHIATLPSMAFEFFLLIGIVPSLTLTDTEHFILALPLVAYIVHHLLSRPGRAWLPFVAIPILLGFGGNWEDALGTLSDRYVHYGILGISNVLLAALATLLFLRGTRSNLTTPAVSKLHVA